MGSYPGLYSEPCVIIRVLLKGGRRATHRRVMMGVEDRDLRCVLLAAGWAEAGCRQPLEARGKGSTSLEAPEETPSDPLQD